jgi:hypothetical protein
VLVVKGKMKDCIVVSFHAAAVQRDIVAPVASTHIGAGLNIRFQYASAAGTDISLNCVCRPPVSLRVSESSTVLRQRAVVVEIHVQQVEQVETEANFIDEDCVFL